MLVRGSHLDVRLEVLVKVAGAVPIPEEGNVAKLLRLGASKGADAGGAEVAARDLGDLGRGHEVVGWQVEVAVVLHHADKLDSRAPLPASQRCE